MRHILIKILLALSILSFFGINNINSTFANEGESKGIKVIVTEKIPGANCEVKKKDEKTGVPINYECTVKKGFSSVIEMLGKIIKYFTYIAGLGGVLFIVINGIMYSMGGAKQSLKDESKERIVATLIGLTLLFLSGVILNMIAPWIYK